MPRRYQPTPFDYMVVAINPALIMVLVGSLIYFLLEMFYQGQYPARLHYCLTLFVFGAVLVGRISMEEGWDRAAPFGAALALVVALALNKFVVYKDSDFAAVGWMINLSMMALTWWCAQRLTWDCTLVDDTQDASGEGLLQTVGLDVERKDLAESATKENGEVKQEDREKKQNISAESAKAQTSPDDDDLGWATRKRKTDDDKSWWQRFVERRRRPHAPGVWIVYFSLAALPLFGIGQVFIPAENTASRRYAFLLLAVYVASGLGLLLTTSFLGLRRYLRQRRLEMPLAMAGIWLITGGVLIVSLLLFAALIPRPNAEYSISELPIALTSEEHDSSKMAVGKEGTKDDHADSGSGKESRPDKSSDSNAEKSKGSGEDSSKQASDDSKNGDAKSEKAKSKGSSKEGEAKSDGRDSKSDKSDNADSKSQQNGESKQGDSNAEKQQSGDQNAQQQPSDNTSSTPPPETPSAEPPSVPDISVASETLVNLIKWVFYGVLVLIALWWSWNHRAELLAFLLAFLTGWWNLWEPFGTRTAGDGEAKTKQPPRKAFVEFSNPFLDGNANRWTPQQLAQYSFEALEAWARDHGVPREEDQTAYEFAQALGARAQHLAGPARALADLYSRAAYSPSSLPANAQEQLQPLWRAFYSEPVPVG